MREYAAIGQPFILLSVTQELVVYTQVQSPESFALISDVLSITFILSMNEYSLFSTKLKACDLIVLTEADETRTYCRFYANGLYQDRMFISEASVKEHLTSLRSEDDVIDWNGVQNLRRKYCEALQTEGEGGNLVSSAAE